MITRAGRLALAFLVLAIGLVLLPQQEAAQALVQRPLTLLPKTATPAIADTGSTLGTTVGTAFSVLEPGTITGVRFYKSAANTGTHTGYLFDYGTSNTPLASVTFSGETPSGWQTAYFATPFAVAAGDQYNIAYYAPNGHYAADANYFASYSGDWPLIPDSVPGGWSQAAPPHQPDTTHTQTNYWVDPIFQPASMPNCPCNVFGNVTPATPDGGDASAYELGLRFKTYVSGYVSGIRFYKAAANTGTHVGHLWDNDGTLLASVTFSGETASGWQSATLGAPILLQQGKSYVVSYTDPGGHYSYDANYFNGNTDVLPFAYAANAGIYKSGSGFPDTIGGFAANYYVDPIFNTADSSTAVSAAVDPTFTFSVGNRSTTCNGEPNLVTTAGTSNSVMLGHLAAGGSVSGAQALTVNSNAGSGFAVYVSGLQVSQNLRSASRSWTDVSGVYGSPAALGTGERFGYTYTDATVASTVINPASANFVSLTNVRQPILGSTSSSAGNGRIAFTVQAAASSPAGTYAATVAYTAVPAF